MELPKQIQIGGQVLTTQICEELGGKLGKCCYYNGYIKIASNIDGCMHTESSMLNTYIHEVTHVILDTMGRGDLSQDETFVSTFAGFATEGIVSILLEKQGESYTKRDVDDAYLKGVTTTKNEIEKQYEANYQIRKDIATFIFNYKGNIKDRAKWIDYLGIKVSFAEMQGEKKPTDKVEPKFKIGDWVVNTITKEIEQVIELTDCEYICSGHLIISFNNQHLLKEWTIQDARDGDVLVTDNGLAFIYNGYLEEQQWPFAYGGINLFDRFNTCDGLLPFTHQKVVPANKEQRNLLFQKMGEAGYEWDVNKREFNKIEQKPTPMSLDEAIKYCNEKSCDNNACALEHKQLEKWLTELKKLKKQIKDIRFLYALCNKI